jgi:hypothetical protein
MTCASIHVLVGRNVIDISSGGSIISRSSGHCICETILLLFSVNDSMLNHPAYLDAEEKLMIQNQGGTVVSQRDNVKFGWHPHILCFDNFFLK